ncbi:response regulator transcription factor [Actinosynnema sp. NPDC020468]|uniref:response regulator transcription factor n=1 Tax=Actinosynnema sp. NPDC020468 TaxID=3154488 RepID=UPI00340A0058
MVLRVLICDELPIIRDGLRTLLEEEPDIEVVDTTDSGFHALILARTRRPDVIVSGLVLKGIRGLELVRRLAKERVEPRPKVVVFALNAGDDAISEVLHAGANGLLTEAATREELASAIRAAANGHTALAPEVAQQLVEWYREQHGGELVPHGTLSGLTPRERQVLLLIARGLSTEGVADELSIGITTVRTHVHRVRAKLRLRDRAQLVSFAYRAGLVRSA